jgi:hypothetical protein
MWGLLRFMISLVLTLATVLAASGNPSKAAAADPEFVSRMSTASVDPMPEPLSMVFLGGGLLLFGAILRRRFRT